ncbi:protocatechuate 3,4-dioxygenase subunit beta [Demequina sp. NBRC 110056]|uniref:protocatechuate 3,4-dioxygenase subunit beta n=1 Tax=Demequina sp. NBRC 110056 TaxID=1570345 RepID=UPI0009FC19A3|nr:protocatechuate 3,4-dioxygenase subunit beta [Demequina sp. NBRC 110056]
MATVPTVAPERAPAPDTVPTQADMSAAIARRHRELAALGDSAPATAVDFAPYRSSLLRHPTKNPRLADPEAVELHSPAFGEHDVAGVEADLTAHHTGEPQGERMTVTGTLMDGRGRPLRSQLVEVWQANASGRYVHQRDRHAAPLDPHFTGAGRIITDDQGRYSFTTIKPGAYPWRNHANAWRPAHIHFSVFGRAFLQRLVTQMYFPGDPMFPLDPIYNSIHRQADRDRLVAAYDHDANVPEFSIAYRFDIVVDGPDATWFERDGEPA